MADVHANQDMTTSGSAVSTSQSTTTPRPPISVAAPPAISGPSLPGSPARQNTADVSDLSISVYGSGSFCRALARPNSTGWCKRPTGPDMTRPAPKQLFKGRDAVRDPHKAESVYGAINR